MVSSHSKRKPSPEVQLLLDRIDLLVQVVTEHGGVLDRDTAFKLTARRAGCSISDMSYVATNAVAEDAL